MTPQEIERIRRIKDRLDSAVEAEEDLHQIAISKIRANMEKIKRECAHPFEHSGKSEKEEHFCSVCGKDLPPY